MSDLWPSSDEQRAHRMECAVRRIEYETEDLQRHDAEQGLRIARQLFYRDGQHLIAASVTTSPGFAVTDRTKLFVDDYVFAQAPHANYDVSPDGNRFLMVKSTEEPKVFVVYGWLSELRSRMQSVVAP